MSQFNPHFSDAPQVFDAAVKFKQRCLPNQQSLFLDGQTLWTAEHFQVLIVNYVKQPDVGDGDFYDKLAGQLASCSALDVPSAWLVRTPARHGHTTRGAA